MSLRTLFFLLICAAIATFVGVMAFTQGTVLMETRRHARELAAQRELADKAEASRFTDLRQHLDQEVARLSDAVERQKQDTLSRIDRAEMGLRERPVDAEIGRLVQAVENHNRDLHARVDRLEMGLREGLADYRPALPSVRPAVTHEASAAEPPADPVGSIAPER